MSTINTNLASLVGQNALKRSQNELAQAIERLSSGLKINSAKDDAAGLAISNRMEVNIRANNQISRGMNDGVSLMQTAEGGLDEVNQLLHRSRELTIQSLNGTLSEADRSALHNEFLQLREEIDRIAKSTEIFGKYPLAQLRDNPDVPAQMGNTSSVKDIFPVNGGTQYFISGIIPVAYIPAGSEDVRIEIHDHGMDDDIQLFTVKGKHLVGTPLDDAVWVENAVTDSNIAEKVFTSEGGFKADAVYDDTDLLTGLKKDGPYSETIQGIVFTYSGEGNDDPNKPLFEKDSIEWVEIDKATEDLILMVMGQGSFNATVSWSQMPDSPMIPQAPNPPPNGEPISIVMSANYGMEMNTVTIQPTPADSKTLGIADTALDPYELAELALSDIDAALDKINEYRGYYGAMLNRFDSASQNIAVQNINLEAAKSRIMDADYAIEVSNMMRAQILQQAGISVLAQANQEPQGVLALLDSGI